MLCIRDGLLNGGKATAQKGNADTPENRLKIASFEARIRELEADLDSQRRQTQANLFSTPLWATEYQSLKREEHIKELDQLSEVHSSTHQVENIMAASLSCPVSG